MGATMIYRKYEKALGVINKINDILTGICIAFMMLVLLLQIFARFIFFIPFPWAQDVIVFTLVAGVFLGVGSATAKGKQIRLEFFVDLIPEKLRRYLLSFADAVSIAFLVVVVRQCISLGMSNLTTKVGSSPIPYCYYYFLVAFGSVIMILNFIDIIVQRFRKPEQSEKGGEPA